jgi:hypothetical protein
MEQPEDVASAILDAIVRLRSREPSLGPIERLKLVSLETNLLQMHSHIDHRG